MHPTHSPIGLALRKAEGRLARAFACRVIALLLLFALVAITLLTSGCASAPVKRVFLGPWPEDTRPYCCHCHAYHYPCHWEGRR